MDLWYGEAKFCLVFLYFVKIYSNIFSDNVRAEDLKTKASYRTGSGLDINYCYSVIYDRRLRHIFLDLILVLPSPK